MGRSQLKDALIEGGIPFNRVHGMHAFEYPGKDPRFNQVFNTAMMNDTTLVMKNILDAYKGFAQYLNQVIVDVGGGLGVCLRLITSKYPSIKGINFDLPHVIQQAPPIPGNIIFIYLYISSQSKAKKFQQLILFQQVLNMWLETCSKMFPKEMQLL